MCHLQNQITHYTCLHASPPASNNTSCTVSFSSHLSNHLVLHHRSLNLQQINFNKKNVFNYLNMQIQILQKSNFLSLLNLLLEACLCTTCVTFFVYAKKNTYKKNNLWHICSVLLFCLVEKEQKHVTSKVNVLLSQLTCYRNRPTHYNSHI